MSTAIKQPDDTAMAEANSFFHGLVKAKALPEAITSPEVLLIILQAGRSMGLEAHEAIQQVHFIKGKIGMSASLMHGLAQAHPDCAYCYEESADDKHCTMVAKHVKSPVETRVTFTIQDAQRQGIADGHMWRKNPTAMLRARARSTIVRAVLPNMVRSVYSTEELQDIEEPKRAHLQSVKAPAALRPEVIVNDPLASKPPVSDVEMVQPHRPAGATDHWTKPFEAELAVVGTVESANDVGKRIAAYVKAHRLENDPATAALRHTLKDALTDIKAAF